MLSFSIPFGRHRAAVLTSEFVIAEDHRSEFCFTQENVDKFVNPLARWATDRAGRAVWRELVFGCAMLDRLPTPKRALEIGPMNRREAPESGL